MRRFRIYAIMARIKITSHGDGWSERLSGNCTVGRSAGKTEIFYSADGDECCLAIENGGVYMRRAGAVRLNMAFRERENSVCLVGDASGEGEISCFTEKISLTEGANGIFLRLVYSLSDMSPITLSAIVIF